ncbi:MAG: hypothetical protein H6807_07110 [Planctomycetes bacterium]|nr:hypothetical protein [Planctomycetota bacterium]
MRLTFVHIVDPTLYEPGTAALAGLARALGCAVTRLPADFGSRQESLLEALVASAPELVLIRVSGEVREALVHVVDKLREAAPGLRFAFHGPLASAAPDAVTSMAPRCFVLRGDPEVGLAGLVAAGLDRAEAEPGPGLIAVVAGQARFGAEAPPADPALAPLPAYDLFEPGFSAAAIGGSLFGEPGTLPLETVIGAPSGLAGNVALTTFNQPSSHAPRLLPLDRLRERAAALRPRARGFEIVDREFGFPGSHYGEVLAALPELVEGRPVSLRMLASTANLDLVRGTAPGLVRRIVCELDAITGSAAAVLPGAQTEDRVRALVELARGRGFEVGLLVSAGLPRESAADLGAKIELVRALAPEALRFLPFSPTHGHPWHALALAEDMMPTGEAAWNREVHLPLRQPGLDEESWHRLWQDCLDLQAEVQLARQPAFGGGA